MLTYGYFTKMIFFVIKLIDIFNFIILDEFL